MFTSTIQLGQYNCRIHSNISSVKRHIELIYPEFPRGDDQVIDADISLVKMGHWRLWKSQIQFRYGNYVPFKPLPINQAPAMMEWGINWSVAQHMHAYWIVHAGVLEKDGKAVLLAGYSGAGKSTTTAALMMSGWRLLSDELAVIDPVTLRVQCMAKAINLKNNSVDVIKANYPDAVFGEQIKETNKGTIQFLKPTPASYEPSFKDAEFAAILFPRYMTGQDQGELIPVSQSETFMELTKSSFNYSILGRAGFDAASNLVKTVPGYQLRFNDCRSAVELVNSLW